jgi:hypothetical protein
MVKKSNPSEITVKTENDTYTLKVPTGALGWKHFRMLMAIENERKNCIVEKRPDPVTGELVDYMLPNPRLDELMETTLDKWVSDILPSIILSHEFEQIPWYDLLNLFQAVCSNSNIDTTNFRDIQ